MSTHGFATSRAARISLQHAYVKYFKYIKYTWWDCGNLMLFPDRMGADGTLELQNSETVDWVAWGRDNGFLGGE
jgi:hypothetical protein